VTLARRVDPADPLFDQRALIRPADFGRPDQLRQALEGVETFYNTYWIRFPRGSQNFDRAIAETGALIAAAREAGVRRIVHFSVTNAGAAGATPYFMAKARAEEMVRTCGLPFAIVRPSLLFGSGDILLNNMAWALRRLPVFGIPGDGAYQLQPVHVDDVARLAVEAGSRTADEVFDAVGPETFAYRDLVLAVRTAVNSSARIIPMPPAIVRLSAVFLGRLVGDVVLTGDEIRELMSGWLVSSEPPRGRTRLTSWLAANGAGIGRQYASELRRNFTVQGGLAGPAAESSRGG
jgi:nucleoside-diphosphate-sugar epimerase